jgi:hypothetical protein
MLKILILLLAICFCVLFSNQLLVAQEEYFPLNVGNRWTYDYYNKDLNNNVVQEEHKVTIIDSMSDYFLFDRYFYYPLGFSGGDSSYFKLEDGKIIRYINGKNLKWYDFSANVGDSWIIPVRLFWFTDTVDYVISLESKTEIFVLDQDTVKNCYRFLLNLSRSFPEISRWEEIFAPGIGLVKSYNLDAGFIEMKYTFKDGIINNQSVLVRNNGDQNEIPFSFILKPKLS